MCQSSDSVLTFTDDTAMYVHSLRVVPDSARIPAASPPPCNVPCCQSFFFFFHTEAEYCRDSTVIVSTDVLCMLNKDSWCTAVSSATLTFALFPAVAKKKRKEEAVCFGATDEWLLAVMLSIPFTVTPHPPTSSLNTLPASFFFWFLTAERELERRCSSLISLRSFFPWWRFGFPRAGADVRSCLHGDRRWR